MSVRPALRLLARVADVDTVHVKWDVPTEMWHVWVAPGLGVTGPSLPRCVDRLMAECTGRGDGLA